MSTCTAPHWVKFFNNAGIPSPASATYAHIFVKNRIELDMLCELNKEYLREMGITPMGDIISILRHSKTVTDQTARDKIMAENDSAKFVAKINPVSASSSSVTIKNPILPRRVLPEHEGKYKISLPKGSTKKSREILAKRSAMQSDLFEKKSIFDRLNSARDVEMADNSPGSSIFKRLGSYKELNKSSRSSGILKNPVPKVQIRTTKQIIEKVRIDDSYSDDDDDDKMDSDEFKQVSFSPEVKVHVFTPRPVAGSPRKLKGLKIEGIRSRLGRGSESLTSQKSLHRVKKSVTMKPQVTSPSFSPRISKMKSDNLMTESFTVHSRLGNNSGEKKFQNKSLGRGDSSTTKGSSVFNRLGRN